MEEPKTNQIVVRFNQELSRLEIIELLQTSLSAYNSLLSDQHKLRSLIKRIFFPIKAGYHLNVSSYLLDSHYYFPYKEVFDPNSGKSKLVKEKIYCISISNFSNKNERYDVLFGSVRHGSAGGIITDFKKTGSITLRAFENVKKKMSHRFLLGFSEYLKSLLMRKQLLSIT